MTQAHCLRATLLALAIVLLLGVACEAAPKTKKFRCGKSVRKVYVPQPPKKPSVRVCKKMFKKYEQCGGTGSACKKNDLYSVSRCLDAPYMLGCCPEGWSCQRGGSPSNWKCRPVQREPAVPMLSPCVLPANETLPKPWVIDYPRDAKKPIHRYLIFPQLAVSWDEANAICQYYMGLHMPSIHDVGSLWRLNNQCFARLKNMCWVGSQDRELRGLWTWNDGTPWDFGWFEQYGGSQALPGDRCIALQDRFQTLGCDEQFGVTCQVF